MSSQELLDFICAEIANRIAAYENSFKRIDERASEGEYFIAGSDLEEMTLALEELQKLLEYFKTIDPQQPRC